MELKKQNMFDDLSQYRATVRRLAILKDGTVFLNSGPAHAAIVMKELLGQAKKSVSIVSGILSEQVFELESFIELNQREIPCEKIVVVLTGLKEEHSDLARTLADRKLATILYDEAGSDYHFASIDREHFRWENDLNGMSASFGFGAERQSENIDDLCHMIAKYAFPLDNYAENTAAEAS